MLTEFLLSEGPLTLSLRARVRRGQGGHRVACGPLPNQANTGTLNVKGLYYSNNWPKKGHD